MRESAALGKIDSLRVPSLTAFLKLCLFAVHVILFLASHALLFLIVRDEKNRLRLILRSNSFHAAIVCWYLNIEAMDEDITGPVRGKLIVCNHLSYVDVLVLFTRYPALFITSKEIEETPLLGQITKLAGCFFTERRKSRLTRESSDKEMALMKKRLSEGFNVFLFPEGTSSDGSKVLPFKAHFFQLAVDSKVIIQPIVLKYSGDNRDAIPWHGDMSFLPHFFGVCARKEIMVNVFRPEKIRVEGKERFALRDEAFAVIQETYEKH